MALVSIHNHSNYCDGFSSLEEMVAEAVNNQISYFGLSSHAPMKKDFFWTMPLEKFSHYVANLVQLKSTYSKKIQLMIGLEADYLPPYSYSFNFFKTQFSVDYVIGSVHLVPVGDEFWFVDGDRKEYVEGLKHLFNNNAEKAIQRYFEQLLEMIEQEKPDVLAHVDKILMHNRDEFFTSDNPTYVKYFKEVLKKAKDYDVVVEINVRGIYTGKHGDYFPGKYSWAWIKAMKVPVVISTDAHRKEELLLGYHQAVQDLKQAGIHEIYVPSQHGLALIAL